MVPKIYKDLSAPRDLVKERISYPHKHNAWKVYGKKFYWISDLFKWNLKNKLLQVLTEAMTANK